MTKRRGEGLYKLRDVPHVQYFEANYAIHGAYWHDVFGIPRSHGCINLAPVDSHRVFLWTEPAVPASWHGVTSDIYDARGQLWQWALANYYYAFDMQAWQAGTSFYHDLNSGGYVVYNLYQERDKGPILNDFSLKPEMFSPEAARSYGT